MKKSVMAVLMCALLFSCATSSTGGNTNNSSSNNKSKTPAVTVEELETVLEEINELEESSVNAFALGRYTEGIEKLVAILALAEPYRDEEPLIGKKASSVEQKLTELASKMTLLPGADWTDDEGTQISKSAVDLGTENAVAPSVLLVISDQIGRSVIGDAPVMFKFLKGEGLLNTIVTTNDFGSANTTIVNVENTSREHIVRAQVFYNVKGYKYVFDTVFRDFTYLPPSYTATILAAEKDQNGFRSAPELIDVVYNALKDVNLDYSPYEGARLGNEGFNKVLGGDVTQLAKLGDMTGVSYVVVILTECYYVNQLGNRNIFISKGKGIARIVRVSDSRIVYTLTVDEVKGQSGNMEGSINDNVRKTRAELVKKISLHIGEIESVLTGQE